MSPNPLLEGFTLARKSAKSGRALPESTHMLVGIDGTMMSIREAEDLGIAAADTARLAARLSDEERGAKVIQSVEGDLTKLGERLATTAAVLRAEGHVPDTHDIGQIFKSFSARDKHYLAQLATDLVRGNMRVDNNMAGAIREIVAKHLPEMRREVIDSIVEGRKAIAGEKGVSMIDTSTRGAVQLPTALDDGQRGIKLGTDRLIGRARGKPDIVNVKWPSGEVEAVRVAGEVEVTVAIEVKGRTNVKRGVEQIEELKSRSEPAYVQIDKQLWLLKYDPNTVKHIVVAPPGPELRAVRAVGKTASGTTIKIIEIPGAIDNQIHALSRYFLENAKKLLSAAL